MNNITFYWLAAGFVFLLFEIGHPGLFFFLSFSGGALSAALATLWTESLIMQGVVFIGATVLFLIILRVWFGNWYQHERVRYHSNAQGLIGKRGVVVEDITFSQMGTVKIQGEIWTARLAHEGLCKKGEQVEVVTIEGTQVTVRK